MAEAWPVAVDIPVNSIQLSTINAKGAYTNAGYEHSQNDSQNPGNEDEDADASVPPNPDQYTPGIQVKVNPGKRIRYCVREFFCRYAVSTYLLLSCFKFMS